MADNDDKPTADEVDEVEMEAARGGAADGNTLGLRHSAKGILTEDPDRATAAPAVLEDPRPGG